MGKLWGVIALLIAVVFLLVPVLLGIALNGIGTVFVLILIVVGLVILIF